MAEKAPKGMKDMPCMLALFSKGKYLPPHGLISLTQGVRDNFKALGLQTTPISSVIYKKVPLPQMDALNL